MRWPTLAAAAGALVIAGTLAAQSVPTLAPGNNWTLSPDDCTIYAEWEGGVSVAVSAHDDHLDLGVYDPRWQVTHDKLVRLAIAPAEGPAETHDALGRRDAEWTGYVADISPAFVDRIAASGALTLTRGTDVVADLDVAGMAVARQQQRDCLSLADDPLHNAAEALENAADAAAEGAAGNAM